MAATFEKIIIGILLMSLFVTSMVVFIGGIGNTYENSTAHNLEENFTTIEGFKKIENTTKQTEKLITNTTVTIGGVFGFVVKGSWNIIKLMFQSVQVVNNLVYDLGNIIGLPKWASGTLGLIFLAVFIFIFLRAAIRWRYV